MEALEKRQNNVQEILKPNIAQDRKKIKRTRVQVHTAKTRNKDYNSYRED